MKKGLFWAVAMLLLAGLSACEKKKDMDGPGTVDIVFRALWEGQPLVMNAPVDYEGAMDLKFAEMDFLLSNARLVATDGTEVPLSDGVALVHFTSVNTDAAAAEQGITFRFEDIPSGDYTGLILGIGLDAATNATTPQDYPSLHPLGVAGNRYWDAWDSYIFSKLQGLSDPQGDGVYELPFAYHAGGTPLYREVTLPLAMEVEKGATKRLTADLQVKALLKLEGGGYWDIVAQSSAHNPDNPAMLVIMNNYASALSIHD